MGITGLLGFVKNSCRPADIKDFSGSYVAVDAYSWLHKGAFSCAEKLVKGEKTDGYVFYCMKQLNMLLEAGLKPIMVFDGCNLESKAVTEKKRRDIREKTRQKGKIFLCEGKLKEARECFQRCVDVTPEMAREVIEACRKKSIDCIVAPYEADAQLAYLIKAGIVQLVITEDSDLILFGCDKILFKLDACGAGLLYEKENLSKSFGGKALKFSFEKFRHMCILSGCDYLPSLPGIGLAKACKFFSLTNITDLNIVLSKLPSYLKMPRLEVPEEYKDSFVKADNTFLYQLVFCPNKKCLVPLTPYPDDITPEDVEYAGKYLPEDVAYQLAMGNINVKTLKEFDTFPLSSSPCDDDKSVLWGSQSSTSCKTPRNSQLSAFKFSTPKEKITSQKRPFTQIELSTVDSGIEASCTDEELFSMYGGQDSKKKCLDDTAAEEDPLAEETMVNHVTLSDESPTVSPVEKSQPKVPNIFRKVVKSRFFATEYDLNKDIEAPSTSTAEEFSSEIDSFLVNDADVKQSSISSLNTSNCSESGTSDLNSNLNVCSPKKSDKENIVHRFAKKKVTEESKPSLLSSRDSGIPSPTKKLKTDSWLDIIDEESSTRTSTLSSAGKSSKLLDVKFESSPSVPQKMLPKSIAKKLISTKLQDFKWSKVLTSVTHLNISLTSDGNSCEESFEEASDSKCELNDDSISSPFFQSKEHSSVLSNNPETVTLSDSEEDSSQNNGNSDSRCVSSSFLNKSTDLKSKVGKVRTIGLSKKRKNCEKVSRKETLLHFNFIRQPKKEVSTL